MVTIRCDGGVQIENDPRWKNSTKKGEQKHERYFNETAFWKQVFISDIRQEDGTLKMAPYIYTERNGIYIIDLQQSVGMVDDAYNAIADIVANGGNILFVGTKKQAQDAIKVEAERCGQFYVNERWLGGMLTNFKTIQSRIASLKDIETMQRLTVPLTYCRRKKSSLKKRWTNCRRTLAVSKR